VAFTAGEEGLAPGSAIRLTIPHGFTPPQVDNPEAPGYVRVDIGNPDAALSLATEPVPGEGADAFRRAGREMGVYLFVERSGLRGGDPVRIMYGAGSGRAYASPFSGPASFDVHLCTDSAAKAGRFLPLEAFPALDVRAGEVDRLEVTAPSQGEAGATVPVRVVARDGFGNRCAGWNGWIKLDVEEDGFRVPPPRKYEDAEGSGIEIAVEAPPEASGPVYVRVREEETGLQAMSNPVLFGEDAPFWGDLHASVPEGWTGSSELDFELSVGAVPTVDQDFFRFSADEGPVPERSETDATPLRMSLPDVDSDEMLSPHLIEVYSSWGSRERWGSSRPDVRFDRHGDRTVHAVLAQGLVAGIAAGSNSRFGPGGDGRRAEVGRGYRGGMTAVYADSRTQDALFAGLKRRRCYATTGARIVLQFEMDGHQMGELVTVEHAERRTMAERHLTAAVHGTAAVDKVEVIRNNAEVCTYRGDSASVSFTWTDRQDLPRIALPRGGEGSELTCYYYIRVTQADGEMAWSSPIWYRVGEA